MQDDTMNKDMEKKENGMPVEEGMSTGDDAEREEASDGGEEMGNE